jgi:hypothetical protein
MSGLSRVRTELLHLAVIEALTPHPVQMHRQLPRHRYFRDLPSSSHGKVEERIAPLRLAAHRDLCRRAWEPTLFMESLRSLTWTAISMSANAVSTSLRRLFALPFVCNGQVDRLPTCNKSIMLPERANGWRKAGFGLEYLDAVPS